MACHTEELELMSAVLDGEATKDETAALYAHLETCEDCARAFRALKSISDAMPENLVPAPEALLPGVMSAIAANGAQSEKAPTPIRKPRVWGYVAAAACLALTVFSASHFGFFDFLNYGNDVVYSTQLYSTSAAEAESAAEAPLPTYDVTPAPSVSSDAQYPSSTPSVQQEPQASPEGDAKDEVSFSVSTEILNNKYVSNSAFMLSETDRLKAAASVAFYDGEYIFDREGERVAPVLENLSEADRSRLFEFLESGTILEYDESIMEELPVYCSFLFTGVAKTQGEGTEDLAVTVWMYGSHVLFRLSSQPPILYETDAFPIDFEDFAESLLGAVGL
ncbi:MAG: zf-HC2 domain-containing protein [Oscillospiraceae bacterium]|jgi:hypothetical protein|nr:zf-HC2 domain-containing protein [Oscillospiraceae bacterium]